MNIKSNKLKTSILTSLIILAMNNFAFADRYVTVSEPNFNSNFQVMLSTDGSTNNGHTLTERYLYWCANDTVITGEFDDKSITLKGGNWYLRTYTEVDGGGSNDKRSTFTQLGSGGMSEDELQQAIDDAIHNVDGDQTVDGNQQVTGDQQVDGEQTVNGGQSVSGGFFHKKGRANYEKTI